MLKLFVIISLFIVMISASSFFALPKEDRGSGAVGVSTNKTQLNTSVYEIALKGIKAIEDSLHEKVRYLAVVDFSLPSTVKRFYLIDLIDSSEVCSEFVCHGKYSGENYATSFSNIIESNKSSLGFYKLSESYFGEHGLSIRMDGLDKGYNDNARERAIVMHAADYADTSVIKTLGRLGRSLGCPALPKATFDKIASVVENNTIIFNYYPDTNYLKESVWLH